MILHVLKIFIYRQWQKKIKQMKEIKYEKLYISVHSVKH